MNVLITIDVEIWCDSWQTLDNDFPRAFERYVFGRSRHGEYGLPKILEVLDRNSLNAVFFIEALFAARFGTEHLAIVVDLVRQAGQEVQLHLHPEWTDESRIPLLPNATGKRQHLTHYSLEEQQALIAHGLRLLGEAGAAPPNAFRAGSFSCNTDTFRAVESNGLSFDASVDTTSSLSAPDLDPASRNPSPSRFGQLGVFPMGVFRDGLGSLRHAQIGACSYAELRAAILDAHRLGWNDFVLLSHNFELLKQRSVEPDWFVVKRFKRLAEFLAANRSALPTTGFHDLVMPAQLPALDQPRVDFTATAIRHWEQLSRRVTG